jgi:hypothetical protein
MGVTINFHEVEDYTVNVGVAGSDLPGETSLTLM